MFAGMDRTGHATSRPRTRSRRGWRARDVVFAGTRTVSRMLLPSTRRPTICARFVVLKRFVLTITLESSVEKPELAGLAFRKLASYAKGMPSAHDVAKYILEQKGEMDTWKLQKLVYYSQAWHLVWEDEPLFTDRIEAWANGPVIPELFNEHRQRFKMKKWPKGNVSRLTKSQKESIEVVLKHYGERTGFALREQTHKESPWKDARGSTPPGASSKKQITRDSIAQYYGSL
jgi:uncharacterized phage-associated protein